MFKWTPQCQDSFNLLKQLLLKEPILCHPDPNKAYNLLTDANQYAWAYALTKHIEHEIDGEEVIIQHLITYQRSLFKQSQLNSAYNLLTDANQYAWAYALTKHIEHEIDGEEVIIQHLITYQRSLFKQSQLNWLNIWKMQISH